MKRAECGAKGPLSTVTCGLLPGHDGLHEACYASGNLVWFEPSDGDLALEDEGQGVEEKP